MEFADFLFAVQVAAAVVVFIVYGAASLRHERRIGENRFFEVLGAVAAAGVMPVGFAVLYGAIADSDLLKFLQSGGYRHFAMLIGFVIILFSATILVRSWPRK